jgi:hypothetical protein
MKFEAAIFVVILLQVLTAEGLLFLKFVGESRELTTTLRSIKLLNSNFLLDEAPSNRTFYIYVSEGVQLNWIDASFFCKMNRMKLAQFRDDLAAVTNKLDRKVLVDDARVAENDRESRCKMIEAPGNPTPQKVSCNEQKHNFLCESDDTEEEVKFNSAVYRNRKPPRFFSSVGGFGK